MKQREEQQTTLTETRPGELVLVVAIEEARFVSDDRTFAVLRAHTEPKGEQIVIVGDVAGLEIGETARLRGRWEDHATYGKRFVVTSYAPVMPSTKRGLVRFLGSGLVPGVGPAIAEKLVSRFGDQTLDVIADQSARLREVSGIGKKKAATIAAAVRARRADAESLTFLHGLGLGPSLARKVLAKYGERTPQQLREDPYLAAEEIPGIGFQIADRVAREVGIATDDPRRAAGAVLHLAGKAVDQGHVYLPRAVISEQARALGVPEPLVEPAITDLAARGLLVCDGDDVYAPPMFAAEKNLAITLARLARDRRAPREMAQAMDAIASEPLAEKQREAVERTFTSGLMVLTGGPGTGKTTTVRALVRAHEALDRRVVLCAPTGRAAKRLSEASGRTAKTVHRMLEWDAAQGQFRRAHGEPLEADLVICDESSMLDVQLANALSAAVPASATLVLVGDVDQLPPVGAGQVLRELILSGVAPVVRLDVVFRQAQKSAIVRGAHEILRGRAPTPTPRGERGDGDLFVVRANEPDQAIEKVIEVLRRIPPAYGLDRVRDVQVLCPMRKGPLGVERLNEVLQAELNAGSGKGKPGALRAGDKVMQLKNDYQREVWNGDLGWVKEVDDGITYVEIEGKLVSYDEEDVSAIALAYACTVHKAQGSEMPAVVLVLSSAHWVMLNRALLYTAITRAKRLVVIVGDERAITRAARTNETAKAYSRLAERLRSAVG